MTAPLIIGLHVGTMVSAQAAALSSMWPANNLIGTILLQRLLFNALSSAGVLDGPIGAGGELNDAVLLMVVVDELKAIKLLKKELGEVALLEDCQIGVRVEHEWQCVYPSPAVRLNWLFDPERREFTIQKCIETNRAAEDAAIVLCSLIKAVMARGKGSATQANAPDSAPATGDHPEQSDS